MKNTNTIITIKLSISDCFINKFFELHNILSKLVKLVKLVNYLII